MNFTFIPREGVKFWDRGTIFCVELKLEIVVEGQTMGFNRGEGGCIEGDLMS